LRAGLLDLKGKLETLPQALLAGLEMIPGSADMFDENYTLDLRSNDINEFVLDYLYKFIGDSRVPNISLFCEPMPIRALKTNSLLELDLSSCDLHSEDLKLLSFFLKINSSLKALNLSRNPLLTRKQVSSPAEIDSIGFIYFVESLETSTEFEKFQLAGVKLSPHFCDSLCKPLSKNAKMAFVDFSACELGAEGIRLICQMCQHFPSLEVLNLRENNCGNEGASDISRLLSSSNLTELDISKNGIMSAGSEALGRAISLNFKLQTLNISDNQLTETEVKLVLDTVFFNTEYVKLKTINEKYGEYGYNLLAESIRKKAKHSKFVYEKLRAKLSNCEDETDRKLAEMLLDVEGNIRLETIPQFYTYNPGDGTVHFFNKK
jgi:Leucine-rich repeat (LRR) protein